MIVSSRRLPARATIAPWKCWLARAQALFVVGGRRGFALLDGGAHRGHALRAAAPADGADFDGAAHGVDVVDVARPKARHEDAAVGVPDHQPLGRQFGEGLADRVAGNPEVLGDGRLGQPGSRQQQALRQLQAQFGRHPVRHGGNGHAQPAPQPAPRAEPAAASEVVIVPNLHDCPHR